MNLARCNVDPHIIIRGEITEAFGDGPGVKQG